MAHKRAIAALALMTFALVSCGGSAASSAAACAGNLAVVDGTAITRLEYRALLRYTVGYYEFGNPHSTYYGKHLCADTALKAQCTSLKKTLTQRMIDQAVIDRYASSHNLLATTADWNAALARERRLARLSGGAGASRAYLAKIGADQAQFRLIESQQIEAAKVMRAIGTARFPGWLTSQVAKTTVVHCPYS